MIAPVFTFKVNGYDVPLVVKADTVNVTAIYRLEGTDTIDLTVRDSTIEYLDLNIFKEGNRVDLYMGYANNLRYMTSGEITEYNPTFGQDTLPELKIRCEDILHKLQANRKRKFKSRVKFQKVKGVTTKTKNKKKTGRTSRVYSKVKDSEIVKKIFRRYNIKPDVDATDGKVSRIHKKDLSDFEFLRKLARINSCYFWVDFDPKSGAWVGHFKKRSTLSTGSATLYTYGALKPSLLSFDPTIVFKKQSTNITIITLDRVTKKPVQMKIKEKGKSQIIQSKPQYTDGKIEVLDSTFISGTKLVFEAYGQNVEVVTNKKFVNKKDAKKWAEAFARANSDLFITGTATVIGNPDLRARSLIYINGVGKRLGGLWEVVEATHKMSGDGPYLTDLKLRKFVGTIGIQGLQRKRSGRNTFIRGTPRFFFSDKSIFPNKDESRHDQGDIYGISEKEEVDRHFNYQQDPSDLNVPPEPKHESKFKDNPKPKGIGLGLKEKQDIFIPDIPRISPSKNI